MNQKSPRPETPGLVMRFMQRIMPKITPGHVWLYRKLGGRFVNRATGGAPALLLTAIGRRTGQPRTVALGHLRDGDDVIAAGTNGGLLGLAGFVIASIGNFVFLGTGLVGDDALMIGGGLYALGLILLGGASLRAGVFSRWVGWLWIASVVVGLPGFVVGSLMEVLFAAGGVALGAAFVLAGYEVWAMRVHALNASPSRR